MIDDIGQLTAPFKSAADDITSERRAVIERLKAFSAAYHGVTIYIAKDVRDQLAAIRSKVVSIFNRHGLTLNPDLNAPDLWLKIGDDYEALTRLRDDLGEAFHRMLA